MCAHGCLCSLGSSACGSCWLLWVGGMVYQLRRFLERIFGPNGAWKLVRIGRLSCQRVLGGFTKCFTTFAKLQVFTNLGVGKNSTVWTGKEPLLRRSVQGLPTPSFGCAAFWNCALNQGVYMCLDSMWRDGCCQLPDLRHLHLQHLPRHFLFAG